MLVPSGLKPKNGVLKTFTAITSASPQSNKSKYPIGTLILSIIIYKAI